MSMKFSLKEALERRAQTKEERPVQSASQDKSSVALLAAASIGRPVDFVRLLTDHGVSLKRARLLLDRAAQRQVVPVEINTGGVARFLEGMHELGVIGVLLVSQPVDPKRIREKQGLSQPDFACLYGLEVDTIKNWEQGRYTPDGPARTLLNVIDRCPRAVIEARATCSQSALQGAWANSFGGTLQYAGTYLGLCDMGGAVGGGVSVTGTNVRVVMAGTLSNTIGANNFAWFINQTGKELSR
jgi:hypothetical protein